MATTTTNHRVKTTLRMETEYMSLRSRCRIRFVACTLPAFIRGWRAHCPLCIRLRAAPAYLGAQQLEGGHQGRPYPRHQPSPLGRGCRAPALSPAGARRVRGYFVDRAAVFIPAAHFCLRGRRPRSPKCTDRSDPSPDPRRLKKAPSRATLSPRERAVSAVWPGLCGRRRRNGCNGRLPM